jgi:hypothetical protein
LADAVGRTSGCVSDILRAHGVKPHLVRTCKVSRDPALQLVDARSGRVNPDHWPKR